jgi:hypothetical protein
MFQLRVQQWAWWHLLVTACRAARRRCQSSPDPGPPCTGCATDLVKGSGKGKQLSIHTAGLTSRGNWIGPGGSCRPPWPRAGPECGGPPSTFWKGGRRIELANSGQAYSKVSARAVRHDGRAQDCPGPKGRVQFVRHLAAATDGRHMRGVAAFEGKGRAG